MHPIHYKYWTEEDKADLEKAGASLSDMLKVAQRVIDRMPDGIHIVSGPITSGGVGTVEGNMRVFSRTIENLADSGINVFSQAPFEKGILKYHSYWATTPKSKEYCWPILLEFYEPLFASKKFKTFHFIPGYEASIGARWEHDICKRKSFEIHYL